MTDNSIGNEASCLPDYVEATLEELEKRLHDKFPAGVPRKKIDVATGYILHPRTCANEDALGIGIQNRFKIGRNTIYPIRSIIVKLRSKIRV